jgi:antitoxin component YwqK of YwqJK toxin-antitoxin module
MGCSQSLKEYTTCYSTGELESHYYMLNNIMHGTFRRFYKNGDVKYMFTKSDIRNNRINCDDEGDIRNNRINSDDKHVLEQLLAPHIHPNMIRINGGYLIGKLYAYQINAELLWNIIFTNTYCDMKIYDENEIYTHTIINYLHSQSRFYAKYINAKLCIYDIQWSYHHQIICNTSTLYTDISIINSIRYIQRRFRMRLYKPILNVLNKIIGINVISELILFYYV